MAFRLRPFAVAAALAAAATGLAAPAASAGKSQRIDTAGGFTSFSATDEILRVNDERGEGYRVVGELRRRNGAIPFATVTDRDGANGEPYSSDLEIREGTKLSLRLVYEKRLSTGAYVVVNRSRWQDAEA
jgi:hypothetical protein